MSAPELFGDEALQLDDAELAPCRPGEHTWLSAKPLGYEDELYCRTCGAWKYPGEEGPS